MNRLARWQRFELLSGEWRLCLACNRWAARRTMLLGFRTISRLGDGVFWYALMLAIAVFGDRDGWQAALHMLLTGSVAALMYRSLKRWTRRPRPFLSHEGIVAHMAPLDEFSFPSGHTLHAVAFTFVALAWFPQLAPLLIPFSALVAGSRVVLGLHYPSDVIVATVIGFALAQGSIALVM